MTRPDPMAWYTELHRREIGVQRAKPARLVVNFTTMNDRRQAYALACAIMKMADETWPR